MSFHSAVGHSLWHPTWHHCSVELWGLWPEGITRLVAGKLVVTVSFQAKRKTMSQVTPAETYFLHVGSNDSVLLPSLGVGVFHVKALSCC